MVWNVCGSITGRTMSALEALGLRLFTIGQAMLLMLSDIWLLVCVRVGANWRLLREWR
tara:strand:- start:1021 stop:1194 length:174 start_codon:yes stop_codon:yes gene_type:complete